MFNAKSLYELALREDIPWRQWNHWVREKIVTYLRDNHRIAAPQPGPGQYYNQQPGPGGYYNQHPNAQPMYPYQQPMQQQQGYYQQNAPNPMNPRHSGFVNAPPQMNPNVQMPPQQAPDWNVPPQAQGAPPPNGPNPNGPNPHGKGQDNEENCSLM